MGRAAWDVVENQELDLAKISILYGLAVAWLPGLKFRNPQKIISSRKIGLQSSIYTFKLISMCYKIHAMDTPTSQHASFCTTVSSDMALGFAGLSRLLRKMQRDWGDLTSKRARQNECQKYPKRPAPHTRNWPSPVTSARALEAGWMGTRIRSWQSDKVVSFCREEQNHMQLGSQLHSIHAWTHHDFHHSHHSSERREKTRINDHILWL